MSLAETPAKSRSAIGELLFLAAPTIAQMMSYTVMQFTDTYMLSLVGHVEAAAAGMSGIISFALISIGFGVVMVVNTLVSQAYGRGDRQACGRYLWQGIWFSLLAGLAVLPLLPWGGLIFSGFGHEPHLAALETAYLQITVGAAAIKLVSASIGQFLLAVNRPHQVLAAAVVGTIANFVVNWVLIYGHFGFPALGVIGAAWGTNVGVLVEMLVLVLFVARPKIAQQYHVRDWRFRPPMMRTLLTVGIPSGVQVFLDVLAWSLFLSWIIGLFGTVAMAANTFMFNYMRVSFMPAYGMAAAVTALVGRYIGQREPDLAAQRAHLGFKLTALYMLACGVVFYFGRYWLIEQFTDDAEVLVIGAQLMIFAALYQLFDAMYLVYNGALRGARDTLVPAVATGVLCWGIALGGGYLMARYFPQLGVAGPWTAATVYGFILGMFLMTRFSRGHWRNIPQDDAPAQPSPTEPAAGAVEVARVD